MRQCRKTAKSIVNQAHIHTLCCLFLKDMADRPPHHTIIDDKIFNKNIFLCLFQFLYKHRKHIISYLEIFRGSILMNRKSGNIRNISGLDRCWRIQLFQLLPCLRPVPQIFPALFNPLFKMLLHDCRNSGTSKHKIQYHSKNRQDEDEHRPRQLIWRINFFI